MDDINYFAQLNYRGRGDKFGIKLDDRRRHIYIIGKTGMGKTVMLQNMAIQDIQNGKGVGILDPHGEFAENILDFVPQERIKDVVYFNPADYELPIGLNLLEDVGYDKRHLVASGLMGIFKKIWVDVWSARMEYILNNAILALLEYPDATLLDINRMMSNKNFRKEVLQHVKDPVVRAFWTQEFAQYSDRLASEATAAIQNKVGQFTTAPLIRNIIGQKDSTIDLREIIDEGKILILNLSKGRIGEDNSRLLGAMVIVKIYLAAMSRIDIPETERRDFFLYVDEFQNFASEAFEGILSEARKYHLDLILAHQYISQMDENVRDAVFGNVGTLITFRIGAEDAEFIEKEFAPEFAVEDLVNLPKFNILLKLMIDGVTSRAFSSHTIAPFEALNKSFREEIIKASREKYGTPREKIEEVIKKWDTAPIEQKTYNKQPQRKSTYRAYNPDKPKDELKDKPKDETKNEQSTKSNIKLEPKATQNEPLDKEKTISLHRARELYPPPSEKKKEFKQPNINKNKEKKQVDIKGLRELLDNI